MSEYGESIAPGTFQIRRILPGPIERLWDYIVDGRKRAQWFAGGEMEPRVGGTIHFWFEHKNLAPPGEPVPEQFKKPSEGMSAPGTVTRIEPPRLLAFLWGGGEVVFELSPLGDEVAFTITHRRLATRQDVINVANGWHKHLDVLAAHLAGLPRQPFWGRIAELREEYERRLPLFVRVTRHFAASAERVFDAWLDPAMLGRWMFGEAVRDEQIVRLEVDPRVGGSFSFVVRRQGAEFAHIGSYRELDRPRKLAFTWGVKGHSNPDDSLVTIEIVPTPDGGCELTLTHAMGPKWAEFKERAEAGWTKMLAKLAEAFAA
ncbi:MAG TPA: SRPBCC domain-containing protein [Tepidisphaeraceae bacterium]|jgi:uncharacterized protein YndB with AHSA1/START domain